MFLVFVLYAVLASTFIFSVKSLLYADILFLLGFRMILAGGILLCWQLCTNKKALKIPKKDWGIFLKVSFFHIYMAFI